MGRLFYGKGIMDILRKTFVENVNSRNYWEGRFSTGDWEYNGGRAQTASFAAAQVRYFCFPKDFAGLIVDFGCGLGDAIPIYKKFFPSAKLLGLDLSESAIEQCKARYGHIASFVPGTYKDIPAAGIIVSSNVFEHLSDDVDIAKALLNKCRELYIIVPYREYPLHAEHLRTYDDDYFHALGEYKYITYPSRGWSEYGFSYIKLIIKNMFRRLAGIPLQARRMQIMFIFHGTGGGD